MAFGSTVPNFIKPAARRLKCQDPRVVMKYNSRVCSEYLANQPFLAFTQQLETLEPSQANTAVVQQYDVFNTWRSSILRTAEDKCRPLRMGGVPYSPPVTEAMDTIMLWKQVLSRKTNGKFSVRYIQQMEKDSGVSVREWATMSVEAVKVKLREAYSNYGRIKASARDRRNSFLEDLASAQAASGNTKVSSVLRQLRHRELNRENSRRIKFILKGIQGTTSLDYVIGPNGVTAYDSAGIFNILAEENKRRFLQSQEVAETQKNPSFTW